MADKVAPPVVVVDKNKENPAPITTPVPAPVEPAKPDPKLTTPAPKDGAKVADPKTDPKTPIVVDPSVKRSVTGDPSDTMKMLDLLKLKITEHQQATYEKPDLTDEVADMSWLLKLLSKYEESPDGKNFKTSEGHGYEIKAGRVSGPEFDGKEIGGPAHIANVMELLLVAKGSFEKDQGYFNTPYEKELPIASYIASLEGFKLKNAVDFSKLDPAVKAEIDKQWALKAKQMGVEVKPERSIEKDGPTSAYKTPEEAVNALTENIECEVYSIGDKYGSDGKLAGPYNELMGHIQEVAGCSGDTTGIKQALAVFEKDYGALLPADKQAAFKTDMAALTKDVTEFATQNKLQLEEKKPTTLVSNPAPATPAPPPAGPG